MKALDPVFSAPFVEETVFFPIYVFGSVVKSQLAVTVVFPGSGILVHQSLCLSLCHCLAASLTMGLLFNLKPGIVIPPAYIPQQSFMTVSLCPLFVLWDLWLPRRGH
jgi:hypothetical protein